MGRAMVHDIQQVAGELGIRTTAEYVESATALQQVRELGVHFVPGTTWASPSPLNALRVTGAPYSPGHPFARIWQYAGMNETSIDQ